MASTIAFLQGVTAIGFPNVCRFIDDGDLAVNSRTDVDNSRFSIAFGKVNVFIDSELLAVEFHLRMRMSYDKKLR